MGHPLLEEFCRQSGDLRPEFYRRCQRVFITEINPMVEEVERLREENATLTAKLEKRQKATAA